MQGTLDYIELFKNIVGKQYYEDLINNTSHQFIQENKNMSLQRFDSYIQIKIKQILIIGICKGFHYTNKKVEDIIFKLNNQLTQKELEQFIIENNTYIDIIKTYVKKEGEKLGL